MSAALARPGRGGLFAALAAAVLAGGCGGDDDAPAGQPDAAYACEEGPPSGGDAFDFRVGGEVGGQFVELVDGDDVPLVPGNQGFYMVLLETRAILELIAPADTVCLSCNAALSSTDGEFETSMPESGKYFYHLSGDSFESPLILVLGPELETYRDATVSLDLRCSGHGLESSVVLDFTLRAP